MNPSSMSPWNVPTALSHYLSHSLLDYFSTRTDLKVHDSTHDESDPERDRRDAVSMLGSDKNIGMPVDEIHPPTMEEPETIDPKVHAFPMVGSDKSIGFGTVDRVAAVGHAGDAPEFEPRRVSGQLVDNTVGESNTSAKTKSELEAKAKKEKANKKQMDTQKRKDVKDAKDAKATARKNKAAVKKRERDAASPGVASADQHEIWLQGKLMTSCEKLIDAASDLTEHKKQGRQAREPSLRATIETLFLRPGKIGRINCKNCLPADLWKDSDGFKPRFPWHCSTGKQPGRGGTTDETFTILCAREKFGDQMKLTILAFAMHTRRVNNHLVYKMLWRDSDDISRFPNAGSTFTIVVKN